MPEQRSLLPPHDEICRRLTEVAQEKRLLEELLKLSVRSQQQHREALERRAAKEGGAARG
jgi:hypothetical protein